MSVTTERPVEKSPKERTRRRNIALALGAAVIVAAIGVSALLVAGEGSDVGGSRAVVSRGGSGRPAGQESEACWGEFGLGRGAFGLFDSEGADDFPDV